MKLDIWTVRLECLECGHQWTDSDEEIDWDDIPCPECGGYDVDLAS